MKTEQFNKIVEEQLFLCTQVLCNKAAEYATDDRLHNFKIAAQLQGTTPIKALEGMMAKHTVSIYDMCSSNKDYPKAQWDEKITDSINYLLILRTLVLDKMSNKTGEVCSVPSNIIFTSDGSDTRRGSNGDYPIEKEGSNTKRHGV